MSAVWSRIETAQPPLSSAVAEKEGVSRKTWTRPINGSALVVLCCHQGQRGVLDDTEGIA